MSNQANRAALFGTKTNAGAGKVTASKTAGSTSPAPTNVEPPKPVSKTAGITPATQPKPQSNGITLSAEAKKKKLEEIRGLLERAQMALKTSMFQWSPDYLVAAPLYEQAGDFYKQIGDFPKAIENYQLAADANEKTKAISSAALALTKAANIAIDNNMETEAPRLLQGVAEYWAAYGDLVRYGETLHKLGKQLEVRLPKKAREYHWQAIRALVPEDMPKEQLSSAPAVIFDMTRNVFTFFLQQQFWSDALKLTKRMADIGQAFQMESTFHKALASETFLTLIMTADVLQAQQVHLSHFSHSDYLPSKECEVADLFIVAIQTQDSDKFDEARRHPQLNYFDAQLAQILRYQLSLENLVEGVSPFVSGVPTASKGNTSKTEPAPVSAAASGLFGSSSSNRKPPATAPVSAPVSDAAASVASAGVSMPPPAAAAATVSTPPVPPVKGEVFDAGEGEEEGDVFDFSALEQNLNEDYADGTNEQDSEEHAQEETPAAPEKPVAVPTAAAPAAVDEDEDYSYLA